MLRRYMLALCLMGLVGVGMASVAFGATPPFGQHFSGKGGNFWNEGSSWVRHGTATFRFRVSHKNYSTTPYVLNFRGTYTTPCIGQTLRVGVGAMRISPKGKFSTKFHSSGAWVKVWGVFKGKNDAKAQVNYLANFSNSKNYNQNNPGSLGCAGWVRGTAHAG